MTVELVKKIAGRMRDPEKVKEILLDPGNRNPDPLNPAKLNPFLNDFVLMQELPENPEALQSFQKIISQTDIAQVNPQATIEFVNMSLIKACFNDKFFDKLESHGASQFIFKTLQEFESNVSKHGFISTITKTSLPDISEFLSMPEMDKKVAGQFDKEAIEYFLNCNLALIIQKLDLPIIEELITRLEGNKKILEPLMNKINKLKENILFLTWTMPRTLNEEFDIDKLWARMDRNIFHRYKEKIKKCAQQSTLEQWGRFELALPGEFPIEMKQSNCMFENSSEKVTVDDINHFIAQLETAETVLKSLKRINTFISE